MEPGATGTRHSLRARSPPCGHSSVPEESTPEIFLAGFLHKQCLESGSHLACNAGSASSLPATHTAPFAKSSCPLVFQPCSNYPYCINRHYRKCKRIAKAKNAESLKIPQFQVFIAS